MINGVSSGQILKLQSFGGTKKLSTEKMFGIISVQLGGDGKTITRENLKQYIQKAENGQINYSSNQLKAFKLLDDNWDDLFGKTDSITAKDFNKAAGIFSQIILANEDKSDLEKLQEEIQKQVEKQKKAKEEQEKKEKEKEDENNKKVEDSKDIDENSTVNNLIEKNLTYTKNALLVQNEVTTKTSQVEYEI